MHPMLWIPRAVAVPFRYFHPLLVYQRGAKVCQTRPAVGGHIAGHHRLTARSTGSPVSAYPFILIYSVRVGNGTRLLWAYVGHRCIHKWEDADLVNLEVLSIMIYEDVC